MECLSGAVPWQSLSRRQAPIHQDDTAYRCWFFTTVALVMLSAWLEPFKLAFMATPDVWPFDGWAAVQAISTAAFMLDTVLHFLVVKTPRVGGTGGRTLGEVAHDYVRGFFVIDLLACFPWTVVVVSAMGIQEEGGTLERYVALLNMFRMLRLYRLIRFFGELSYNTSVSQVANMVVRNTVFVSILMHWAACTFWWVARQQGFSENTWVGRAGARFVGGTMLSKQGFSENRRAGRARARFVGGTMLSNYTYSYNDLSVDSSWAECLITSAFLLLSILLMSYILGTFTMLLMANDKRSKKFRERMTHLGTFHQERKLPRGLLQAMKEHVQLHHNSEQLDDDKVMHGVPTLLRRTVLRHLYTDPLGTCHIFQGCSPLFLDSVMMACKVELFMPKVQVLSAGDMVTDLLIIVGGAMQLIDATAAAIVGARTMSATRHPHQGASNKQALPARRRDSHMQDSSSDHHDAAPQHAAMYDGGGGGGGSVHGSDAGYGGGDSVHGRWHEDGSVHGYGGGSVLGSVTGGGSKHKHGFGASFGALSRSPSMASSYTGSESYGGGHGGAGGSHHHHHGGSNGSALKWADAVCQLSFFTESPCASTALTTEVTRIAALSRVAWDALLLEFPTQGILVYENLVRQEEQNLESVITSACDQQQISPAAAALLLRLVQGSDDGSEESQGAAATARECLGPQQLTQLQQLADLKASAAEHAKSVRDAIKFEFLNTAAAGATAKLQLLLEAGADPNMVDFGGRSALMLAAFSGRTEAVQLLLNRGAQHGLRDRAGHTALFEAVKAGKDEVMDMLLATGATLGLDRASAASHLNTCMSQAPAVPSQLRMLRRLLRAGVDPDAADYDSRTALHTAAAAGYLVGVRLMVDVGRASVTLADRWQRTALDDARRFGAAEVVAFLEEAGSRRLSATGAPITPGPASPRRGSRSSVRERFTSACLAGQLAHGAAAVAGRGPGSESGSDSGSESGSESGSRWTAHRARHHGWPPGGGGQGPRGGHAVVMSSLSQSWSPRALAYAIVERRCATHGVPWEVVRLITSSTDNLGITKPVGDNADAVDNSMGLTTHGDRAYRGGCR
ncbi:MAG: hypothetical protein WDW38_010392 [Sanguina aurantia]